jgi:hypothetical protein
MEHPITPLPELVQRLCDKAFLSVMEGASRGDVEVSLILEAYAAGADQELEACCEWANTTGWEGAGDSLRAARRPKPQSLKDRALEAAKRFYAKGHEGCADEEIKDEFNTVCSALEQLND